MTRRALILLLVLASCLPALAQRRPDGGEGKDKKKKDTIKPYDQVITDKARTDSGLFIVHRVEDAVFYEIPSTVIEKELLWVTQIAKTQSGFGYGGTSVGNRVVRWQLRDETVLLRDVKFRIRAPDAARSVKQAVEATSLEPIIRSFPVKAWGKDRAPVIDVTALFMEDVPQFSAKRRLNASGIDKKRSFFESVKSFPGNIETEVMLTYKLSGATSRGGGSTPAPRRRRGGGTRRDPSQDGVTVTLHHSMVALPDRPMTPRRHDDRVGFFNVSFEDYGDAEDHEVERIRYITRWRLEKKDATAAVSDPVDPIVFYVGRGVPERWRAWVRKGIEAWRPAFEAAGFSNAILAKDAPSDREDPDWDAEDARYSTIRWMPSTVENAMGPHVHDPRTGEILEADIIMYHNVLKLVRDWYFVQASPSDPSAQTLPLKDDLIGRLLAYVVTHEVGHSLGFPHNMKASASFSVAQLRDPVFTKKNGTEASIMDYGRFNYVAQPGDGAALVPVVGPYDFFAVDWGYRQYSTAKAESKGLAVATARQKDEPMLRFGNPNPAEDPSQQTEDLGSDAIEATALGLLNVDRVASYLVKATCREGKNYDLLRNMYDRLVGQRNRELLHVANVVGGVERTNLWFGDRDRVYDTVSSKRQRDAVAFLNEHGFRVPDSLIQPDILLRLEASGAADRILSAQKRLLNSMVSEQRVKRMAEHATRFPDDAYLPVEMLEEIREEIWSELQADRVKIDLYRRNLQRAHVEALARFVKKETAETDLPALSRSELELVLEALRHHTHKAEDRTTQAHLKDQIARIMKLLDKKAMPGSD